MIYIAIALIALLVMDGYIISQINKQRKVKSMRLIDPVDIKQAVKSGQLKAFVKDGTIYISDTQTGDTVEIGKEGEEHD